MSNSNDIEGVADPGSGSAGSNSDSEDLLRLAAVSQSKSKSINKNNKKPSIASTAATAAIVDNNNNTKQSKKSKQTPPSQKQQQIDSDNSVVGPDPNLSSYQKWQQSSVPLSKQQLKPARIPIKIERQRLTRESDINSGIVGALQSLAVKKQQKAKLKKLKKIQQKQQSATVSGSAGSAAAADEQEDSNSESEPESDSDNSNSNNTAGSNASSIADSVEPEPVEQPDPDDEPIEYSSIDEEIAAYREQYFITIKSLNSSNNNTATASSSSSTSTSTAVSDLSSDPLYYPIRSFTELISQFQLSAELIQQVLGSYKSPTPIQSQCWPILLSGRDCIGIAATGTGKTLAFLLPAIVHVQIKLQRLTANNTVRPNASPFVLILAPTRELAAQIHSVNEKSIEKLNNIKSILLTGGPSIETQSTLLQSNRVEFIIATTGRLIKLLTAPEPAILLNSVSLFILDEADRMLDLGFEAELKQITAAITGKRQTALFSATWPSSNQSVDSSIQLVANSLTRPDKTIHIQIGSQDLNAAKLVRQEIEVIDRRAGKREQRLLQLIPQYYQSELNNRILIFCLYKREAQTVAEYLQRKLPSNIKVQYLTGNQSQAQRKNAIDSFKSGITPILVATDVAARGLDINNITHVINFSLGLSIEHYIHRIGRTGRAGLTGIAHTFIVDYDSIHVPQLIQLLKQPNSNISVIPTELYEIADRAARKAAKHQSDSKYQLTGDARFNASNYATATANSDSDSIDEDAIFGSDARTIQNKGKKQHAIHAGGKKMGRRGGFGRKH